MDILEMHIGIDLGIQQNDSAVFLDLLPEQKDYYINRVTYDIIKKVVNAPNNNRFNIVAYQDIRAFYNKISNLIYNKVLPVTDGDDGNHAYATLPSGYDEAIGSQFDLLTAGNKYTVAAVGSTPLTDFGAPAGLEIGTVFTCAIDNILKIGADTIDIVAGCTYTIIRNGPGDPAVNFTGVGAPDSLVGTTFVANLSVIGMTVPLGVTVELRVDKKFPAWDLTTTLYNKFSLNYHNYLSCEANITIGTNFTSGALVKGKKYKVVTAGSTNLYAYGHTNTPVINTVFVCTASGTPTWDGVTTLIETKDSLVRLVKPQDLTSLLNHAYGTVPDSPIAVIANDGLANNVLKVYHDGKFVINEVNLNYVVEPINANWNYKIPCALNNDIHYEVVDNVVLLAMAQDGSKEYQNTKIETQ